MAAEGFRPRTVTQSPGLGQGTAVRLPMHALAKEILRKLRNAEFEIIPEIMNVENQRFSGGAKVFFYQRHQQSKQREEKNRKLEK